MVDVLPNMSRPNLAECLGLDQSLLTISKPFNSFFQIGFSFGFYIKD